MMVYGDDNKRRDRRYHEVEGVMNVNLYLFLGTHCFCKTATRSSWDWEFISVHWVLLCDDISTSSINVNQTLSGYPLVSRLWFVTASRVVLLNSVFCERFVNAICSQRGASALLCLLHRIGSPWVMPVKSHTDHLVSPKEEFPQKWSTSLESFLRWCLS